MADLLGGEEFEECKAQVIREQKRSKSGKKARKIVKENDDGDDENEAGLPTEMTPDESGFDLHPMVGFEWLYPIKHKVQPKAVQQVPVKATRLKQENPQIGEPDSDSDGTIYCEDLDQDWNELISP